ncbi:MAG TPA: DUF2202 domain-containing protein [Candidatus Limiplasma sp.]|nr:DUF2202 domain-containing protein [Candidatus Limiplasma sp.]
MKRLLKVLAVTLALAALPVLSLAEESFGSASVNTETTYTLTEMLTYAMQDEYLAEAEYIAIQEAFGVDNPFTNIMGAEVTHQETLQKLFETYGIEVPENTAADHVVIPETLQETYEVGVQAEITNIAMYEAFLAQGDLPQDVVNAFTALMTASQSHLEAFARNAENDGVQLNLGDGNQYGQGNENAQTNQNAGETQQNGNGNGGN